MKPGQPVVIATSANGFWIIPIPGPMAIPDGSVQRWDKKSLYEFLEKHFPDKKWNTEGVMPKEYGGHA